jgi:FkbM family methyltransferase
MNTQVIEFLGKKFVVRSDKPNDVDVIKEVFVNDVYKLRQLKERGVNPKFLLDVGGHIGTFSVLAKTLWPDCKIVAFEPVKENFELYRQNMEINGFKNVTLINKGINYDTNRTIFVNDVKATGGGTFIRPESLANALNSGHYKLESEIVCSTLEKELADIKITAVDIAKFDCEGGEREAFRLMDETLLRKIKFIVGEYHGLGENADGFISKYFYRLTETHKFTVPEQYKNKTLGIFYAEPK